MATVICVRVDAYSVLYSICLGILLLLSRRKNALVWPIFTIILTVLLPVQYILCLGFPPGACIGIFTHIPTPKSLIVCCGERERDLKYCVFHIWNFYHKLFFAEYPWKFTTETGKNLETWLYLPSYFDPPDVNKLIGKLRKYHQNNCTKLELTNSPSVFICPTQYFCNWSCSLFNKANVKFSLMTKEFLGIFQVCFSVIMFIL